MHSRGLKHNNECLDLSMHDKLYPPECLRTNDGDSMSGFDLPSVQAVNLIGRAESKLDRLWAPRRNRLQSRRIHQAGLELVVVTDKLPKGRRGLCTANHGMQAPRLLPVYAHLYSIVATDDELEDCTEFARCRVFTIASACGAFILLCMNTVEGMLFLTRRPKWALVRPRALCVAIAWCALEQIAAGESPARASSAAERAIALLQQSQKTSHEKQGCPTCHHQYLPALAFHSAREHGVPVNEDIARKDAVRAFDYTNLDRAVQYTHVIEPSMNDALSLIAAHASGLRPNLITAVYARLIARRQLPDGTWDSFHQRPPQVYSRFTHTAIALRAIQLYSHPSERADARKRVQRARSWLAANPPKGTEELTYQLLGLYWAGGDRTSMRKGVRSLLSIQQPDGGWGSLDGRASDAYSTGEALVALHDAGGIPVSDSAWQRGIQFLLDTQMPDGSWHVTSRVFGPVSPRYVDTGYPYGHDQFISAMGASWAVMALSRALGPARPLHLPALEQRSQSVIEPWIETILFGTHAELKHLLDHGLNPNAATTSGTTALMLAAPDVDKMKLLLDRGAAVNARARTKYSALMVAAQYRESTPAVNLLLDRGAEVRLPSGQGAPLFNAHPLFLAAYSGNFEVLKRLRDSGDRLDDQMVVLGQFASTPLMAATVMGNAAVVRALLDLGAPVDQADTNGITPLARAALGNQVGIAQLLIDRAAAVNSADKLGMTPLMRAASIDFGDSEFIDVLLKAGADAGARNTDGSSALDLARRYTCTHLLATLIRHNGN
jgi:ankyrin repeat protein